MPPETKQQKSANEQSHKKLPQLPSHAKVAKRPLLRPAIPSPYSSSSAPKVIYISSRTGFVPTVKRVQGLLKKVENRSMQSLFSTEKNARKNRNAGSDAGNLYAAKLEMTIGTSLLESKAKNVKSPKGEAVYVRATGKAIEKLMGIALFFQEKPEYKTQIKTGTVDAIDDLELPPTRRKEDESEDKVATEEGVGSKEEDVFQTRVRQLSMLEVAISLR